VHRDRPYVSDAHRPHRSHKRYGRPSAHVVGASHSTRYQFRNKPSSSRNRGQAGSSSSIR
jgi:hypothetical protein